MEKINIMKLIDRTHGSGDADDEHYLKWSLIKMAAQTVGGNAPDLFVSRPNDSRQTIFFTNLINWCSIYFVGKTF